MEFPSDLLLLYLIQIQRVAEEVHEAYYMQKIGGQPMLEQMRLQTHAKTFRSQLQGWKASLPVEVEGSGIHRPLEWIITER